MCRLPLLWLLIAAISVTSLYGQGDLPPKQPYPFDIKQIHSGHSLTDPLFHPWPGLFVQLMTEELGYWAGDIIGKSTIPGSNMAWRWNNPPEWSPDARHDIGDWELLGITEGVPLYYEGGGTAEWYLEGLESQRMFLSLFVNNAWENGNNGNGAPTLLWTTWTNIDHSDGPWREMLDIQGEEWENMQVYANDHRPAGCPPVYLIPGHKMMARIYDDIQLGLVPGITDISEFFSDNIHVNNLGSYAVAMIHYACIFNTSPVGLPTDLVDGIEPPSQELADYLQNMIWEVVTNYPRTGIYAFLNVDDLLFETEASNSYTQIRFSFRHMKNLKAIELQHCGKGSDFITLSEFPMPEGAHGIYNFKHVRPLEGKNYYRLKFTTIDGHEQYSPVRTVVFQPKIWEVFPNPAKDYITVQTRNTQPLRYVIRDLNGKICQQDAYKGNIETGGLAPGTYLLGLYSKNLYQQERLIIIKE